MKPQQKFFSDRNSETRITSPQNDRETFPERLSQTPETTKKIGQEWVKAMTACQFPETALKPVMLKLAGAKSPEEKLSLVEDASKWGMRPEEVHARFTAAFWVGLSIQAKIRQGFLPEYFKNRYTQTLNLLLRQLLPNLPLHIQKEAPLCRLLQNGAL